jgi:hypothetical protein
MVQLNADRCCFEKNKGIENSNRQSETNTWDDGTIRSRTGKMQLLCIEWETEAILMFEHREMLTRILRKVHSGLHEKAIQASMKKRSKMSQFKQQEVIHGLQFSPRNVQHQPVSNRFQVLQRADDQMFGQRADWRATQFQAPFSFLIPSSV